MKITKTKLKQIIQEELERVMSEGEDFSTHEAAVEERVDDLVSRSAGLRDAKQDIMAWAMDPSINLGVEDKNRLYNHGVEDFKEKMGYVTPTFGPSGGNDPRMSGPFGGRDDT